MATGESDGTWRLDCKEYDTSGGHCVGHQIVTKGTSNKEVVLGVMVSYANEHSAPHIIFRTTPEANVKKGVAVKIDQNKFLRVPISSCDDKVCEVRSLIPKGLLQQMLSGKQLLFAFFIDETQHTYPVSLVGFKEMMTNLSMNESRS